jgi:hypothetical protein
MSRHRAMSQLKAARLESTKLEKKMSAKRASLLMRPKPGVDATTAGGGLCRNQSSTTQPASQLAQLAVTARLHGFDTDDSPLITQLSFCPGELVRARTAVRLASDQAGAEVLVVLANGDVRRPVIIGVLQRQAVVGAPVAPSKSMDVHIDDDRYVIAAEREIVLRCGESSITLTRAGKVIIKGNHIVSRSTGYNRIKGAAVDIN